MKRYKKDDSDMIWFDFNEVTREELEACELQRFDVFNVPEDYFPDESEKYFITSFTCKFGNCLMYLKKRKDTIKIEDCNPKKQPCVLTNHGIDANVIFK